MKIYLRTFGCQMNERDSEWAKGLLLEKGFSLAESKDNADVIIFNTCSVRKHAEDKMISNMGVLKKLKAKKPQVILGLMGCTAEYQGKALFRTLPHLDFVVGTGYIDTIPEIIEDIMKKRSARIKTGDISRKLPDHQPEYRDSKDRASVAISRGCDNHCTYCIVPHVRGPERSRRPEEIISEVESLLSRGCLDIMLLGQNVNSYGKDLSGDMDFIKLLDMIDRLKGKKRISFMTSHPKDASAKLFEAMRELEGLSKDLHLPLQSGSDKILKAMNRGYDPGYYYDLAARFRKTVPSGRLTTDVIVGFPGETDEDFAATKKMMQDLEFDSSFIFKYSPRPPAPSAGMEDDVPRKVKEERHRELLEIQRAVSKRKMKDRDP